MRPPTPVMPRPSGVAHLRARIATRAADEAARALRSGARLSHAGHSVERLSAKEFVVVSAFGARATPCDSAFVAAYEWTRRVGPEVALAVVTDRSSEG